MKRKSLRENVTKACSNCKLKHKKCSGSSPCDYCATNNSICTFEQSNSKRGPESGKINSLKKIIKQLERQIEQEQSLSDWVTKALEQSNPSTFGNNRHQQITNWQRYTSPLLMNPSTLFHDYLQVYNSFLLPICGIPLLNVSASHFYEAEDPKLSLSTFSAFCNTAQFIGNMEYALEFEHRASLIFRDCFELTDPTIAGSHTLMTYYYSSCGFKEKYMHHNALALTMSQSMMADATKSSDDEVVRISYAACLMNCLDGYTGQRDTWMRVCRNIQRLVESAPLGIAGAMQFILKLADIWSCSFWPTEELIAHRSEILLRFDDVDRFIAQIPGDSTKDACWSMVSALRAAYCHLSNEKELSLKLCRDTMLLLNSNQHTYVHPFHCCTLSIIAQIHLYEDCQDLLANDINLLSVYSKYYPVVQQIVDWLHNPDRQTIFLLWPMIHIHPIMTSEVEEESFPDPLLLSDDSLLATTESPRIHTAISALLPENFDIAQFLSGDTFADEVLFA